MKKEFSLSENYSFVGEWWLPGNEDNKVIGCLNYSPETGLDLDLEGHFKENEFPAINGNASGRFITLINCFSRTLVTPLHAMVEYAPTKITANMAIVNAIIPSEESLELEWASFETNDIKTWSWLTGVNDKDFYNELNNNGFNLTYTLPDSQDIYSNDEVNITLNAAISVPSLFPPPSEIIFKERNYFKIENKANLNGLYFFEYIDAIRKFVSFAMRENIKVENVKLRPKGTTDNVYLFYSPIPIDLDYCAKKPSFYNMFFALPNVRDKITHLFECWLDGYRNLETVYNLYFYKSRGMLHNVFLSKAQALEEFHRSTKENSEKWGFKSRIGNLYDKYEPIMKLTGDKESFCQLALDHRDYYSHWF